MSASRLIDDGTIVAISTPPGRGGIGIVRLSGSMARPIAESILKLRSPLAHATARLADIVMRERSDPENAAKLDEAMVTYFAAPHSYTSEDVVEIAAHGSPVVLEFLIRHALAQGARLARPGEFTERAFLSGRMDLTQAEAVRDLIDAKTILQARLAAVQMGGALSRRIAPVKELLLSLMVTLEAGIDFAEDDIDVMPWSDIATKIVSIEAALAPIAASYAAGRIVHDGVTLAIVGKPNAGKSSLFNRLIERERAIVTATAGTTRDLVTERMAIEGIPVELVDTAGLRSTMDEVESIGITKTREAMADADLILAVFDVADAGSAFGGGGIGDASQDVSWQAALTDPRTLLVANKIDLLPANAVRIAAVEEALATATMAVAEEPEREAIAVSALSGDGIVELRRSILAKLQAGHAGEETGMLTTMRHFEAITACAAALRNALQAAENRIPHEMLLLDLQAALQQLDSLTGTTTAEDILNRIFSSFCIGK